MRSNENKDFGKKPVRRSKSEESEPAKVYRPRTARIKPENDKSTREEPYHTESSSEGEEQVSKPERKPDKGYDKDTGYSRKGAKSDSYSNDKEVKRMSPSNTNDSERTTKKRIVRKPDSSKGRSSSSELQERNGNKPFKRDDKRERNFGRSDDSRSYRDDRSSKPRSNRRDDSYDSNSRSDRKYSKPTSSGKVLTTRSKKDGRESGTEKKYARKAPFIESELKTDSEGFIRLNKYISNSGLCSRREADEYIQNGMITVNGVVTDQLGTKIKLTDEVQFKGKELDPERKVYILLNKPKDFITTVDDPNAKRTVMDLIEGACDQRVYPVGRLDRNSTGLLLLTNDGELTKRLTHPSYEKKKVYEVGLDRPLDLNDQKAMVTGIELEDETVKADAVEYIDEFDQSNVGVEIHSGQNRVVRRIFEKLGYKVQTLDRVYFAGLTKKNLPRGKWRFLKQEEVSMLKMSRFE